MNEMKRVTVVLPADVHKMLKYVSFDTETTMNDLILKAVKLYLRKKGYMDNNLVQDR